MAVIASRAELVSYIKRKLGEPVIDINIADEQIEDCIQDAFDFFLDYHYEGQQRKFYAVQLTEEDIQNRYIETPTGLLAVSHVFKPNDNAFGSTNANSLFSYEYHFTRNEIFGLARGTQGASTYFITETYFSQLVDTLQFNLQYRYRSAVKKLYIDTDWNREFRVGDFLVYEGLEKLDPEEYPELYNEWVIKDLTVAMAKKQWGMNLSKYQELQLPGGVTLNGDRIMEEGKAEIEEIKSEFVLKYQEPDGMLIG